MTSVLGRIALALAVLAASCTLASPVSGATADSATVRESAASWAEGQVGIREKGTTNCSPVINRWEREMGLTVPPCRVWCGAFVHQAFRQAGVQLSRRLIDPNLSYGDAMARTRGLRRISIDSIERGDIVFYKFRRGLKASHMGIARGRPSGGKLDTAEGNTSHAVRLERRGVRYIVLAARVTGDA